MQKLIAVVLACYMLYIGITGFLSGSVSSMGGTVTASGAMVSQDDKPIEFTVTVVTNIAIGVWLIYMVFSNRNDNDENE